MGGAVAVLSRRAELERAPAYVRYLRREAELAAIAVLLDRHGVAAPHAEVRKEVALKRLREVALGRVKRPKVGR